MGHYDIQKKSTGGRGAPRSDHSNLKSVPTIQDATPVKLEQPEISDSCTRCGGLLVSHWCMNINYDAGGNGNSHQTMFAMR